MTRQADQVISELTATGEFQSFSALPLSIDARSALRIFAAAFAVIERLAPFVICQLMLECPQPASIRADTIAAAIRPVVSITMSNSTCHNNNRGGFSASAPPTSKERRRSRAQT